MTILQKREGLFCVVGDVCTFNVFQLDVANKRIAHIEQGLHVFIKVQLGLFSAMIVLFAIVMYYATYLM